MQQFVNQSLWEHEAVLHRLRQLMGRRMSTDGVLVLDDTSLPKQGRHSVGIARQDCGERFYTVIESERAGECRGW